MTKIFISYRRIDSQYVTDSIHDHLCRHFGTENVFLDVGSIPPGVDFRAYLRDQIAAHDVVIVVIGPDWGRIMQEKADQPNDFVRIEIENALKQNKLVIPVLVKNADMPDFAPLPESIRDLQWRNNARIRRKPDLEGDCQRLADGIKAYMAANPTVGTRRTVSLPRTNKSDAEAVRAVIGDPFDWCEVPAGEFIYGDDDNKHAAKQQKLHLPIFYIAKYPITNGQYAAFIEAGGYNKSRWWTDAGWKERQDEQWTQPRFWDNSKYNDSDQPVVGVSWYECMAFCNWLGDAAGETIHLPTEFEWEKAARGTDGWIYPYGNEFDKTKCNTGESGIGRPTPVTAYPNGASPYGVLDMSGNVFEWMLSDYDNPQINAVDENISSDAARALLCGSWSYVLPLARAASRYNLHPDGRRYGIGFRVVRLPHLS